ncbi:adenylate/guanylate cyclase domain-containing protein [Ascidiaceihabitans sp.]|uniref:adenylate/guanylate cyclase domain-containing protein n=1 Tax=Ascidiaceihabitans sp. TaxID=1872644 RepID=UPI003296C245
MPDLSDTIISWLNDQALTDDDLSITLSGLAKRLVDGGIPVARINVGRSLLHPTIVAINAEWNVDVPHVEISSIPRKFVHSGLFDNTPFGDIIARRVNRIHADLKDPAVLAQYPMYEKFKQDGIIGYAAFGRHFGKDIGVQKGIGFDFNGAAVSFSTRRFSGFSKADIDTLDRIISALCICSRVHNDTFLMQATLETYLGRHSAGQVLSGKIERGEGEIIECAILYSDLKGSLGLSQTMDMNSYFDTVNAYFDCTARAVTEHGGEVLKFIGDGVLAIFPIDNTTRPRANMCAAALSSAQEAFARAAHENTKRATNNLPPLEFGIALHVGEVLYGNVGTESRLDFTATGPAVGLAARVEAHTRAADTPLLATAEFADACPTTAQPLEPVHLPGFTEPVALASYQI